MDTQIFSSLAKTIVSRRPTWQFIIEDNVIRVLTHQFQVEMAIFLELIEEDKDLSLVEITMHREFGCVVTLKTLKGI